MTAAEAIAEFLGEQRARGNRPRTIQYYNYCLHKLLREYLDDPVETVTAFACTKVLNAVAKREVKPATLASYDRSLRTFTCWLTTVELLSRDPMKARKRPKVRWEPKQILSIEEIRSLFRSAAADKRYKDRHVAMLFLLLGCGLRAGEVATLRLVDIDWEAGVIRVNGKTGYGIVPANRQVMKALRRYVTHSRKGSHPNLFFYNNRPISTNTLSHLLNRLGRRAGIKRPVGPHLARHSFATNFILSGGDVFSLKRILRHTTLHTSMLYVHSSSDDLRERMERSNSVMGLNVL